MNLNNKYLAVGLSITAVVVVSYQIFFNKPTQPARQPMKNQPMFSQQGKSAGTTPPPRPKPAVAESQQTAGSSTGQGLVIDYNSEILLQRVPPEAVEPYPRQELEQEFGGDVFSKGEVEPKKETGPKYQREVEFKLNAIIIDRTRKIAIINDTILTVGDHIQGAEVVSIVKSKVVLSVNGKEVPLSTNSRIKKVKRIGGKGEN